MKFKGLFVGLTTIDIQFFVDHFPKPNVKIKTSPPSVWIGGPATNAAVAFAKLNDGAFLASASGQHAFSEYVLKDFIHTNISHYDLVQDQRVNPVIASVITSGNGERNIFTHSPVAIKSSWLAKKLMDHTKPEVVLLDGFYPEFSLTIAQLARESGARVVIDCGSWKPQYEKMLPYAHVVICSNDFFPPGCNSAEQVFQFIEEKGVEHVAISRGEKNILYGNKANKEMKINKTKEKDTLGAGDFLHGAFCYYYCKYDKFNEALKSAAELASYTCRYKGTRKWLNYFPE